MQFSYFLPVSQFLQLGHFIETSFKENLLLLKINTEDIESFKTRELYVPFMFSTATVPEALWEGRVISGYP